MKAPYTGTLCGAFAVDVNGNKPPNTWGRDLFYIYIQKDKIIPQGPSNNAETARSCDKSASKTLAGFLCAEYVVEDKDY